MLSRLAGAAAEATEQLDPETIRARGHQSLIAVLDVLDAKFQWQPESVLFKAMEEYLYFSMRKSGESIGSFLARYQNALGEFVRVIQTHLEQDAKREYESAVEKHLRARVEWLVQVHHDGEVVTPRSTTRQDVPGSPPPTAARS